VTRTRICRLVDLPESGGLKVEIASTPVAVFRVGDDAYALADRCSHAEASLSEGEVFGLEVECPRHGAVFDLATGEALTLPATKPVAVYRTLVEDGDVFVLEEAD
jgi:3-phenylpropionate/trans-cinnamate dioxygenase ferredoxin component